MSAPQPPADGRPRDDEPRTGGAASADGAAGTYEFHGEQLVRLTYSEPAGDLIPVHERSKPFSSGGGAP